MDATTPPTSLNFANAWAGRSALLEHACGELDQTLILKDIRNFDWLAAHFTILHIGLAGDGGVQHHRDVLPAIGAGEEVLHEGNFTHFAKGISKLDDSCTSNPKSRNL